MRFRRSELQIQGIVMRKRKTYSASTPAKTTGEPRQPTQRTFAMNRFSSLAIATVAASAALFSTTGFAQSDAAPAGKTRAEVMAETRIALRNGEIRDGHEWAMYQPRQPQVARRVPVTLATTAPTATSTAR
jgi:hypothetical protein